MSDFVINVENLSKQYRIGSQKQGYKTFREAIVDTAKTPFRLVNNLLSTPSSLLLPQEDTIWALRDISFEIKQGEVVGIIGRNGAGKSTLLKVLSKITEPTKGRVLLRGRVGSLLEVGTGFHPELTGHENIYLYGAILGMDRFEVTRKFDEIVAFAEIEKFINTPVKRYSSGMYMRLAFAVAAHLETEILFVDEVLAVGDVDFQKKCLGKMDDVSKEGRTVLIVSHNMDAISRLCNRGVFIEDGQIRYIGSVNEAIAKYTGALQYNKVIYNRDYVEQVSIYQRETKLEIALDYNCDKPLRLPCLGFVVSDFKGYPIFGANPLMLSKNLESVNKRKGTVRVFIESPILINGTYRLSIWFGDGKQDFFVEKDAMSFDVVNMSKLKNLPGRQVGSVVPICRWYF